LHSPSPSPTRLPAASQTPEAPSVLTITPGSISPAELPLEAHIAGIRGQDQSLPLSCESRSAVDWASFFGVAIEELDFQHRLPRSDDPELGFVGDVGGVWGNIPPRAYGVHAAPVAALLTEYGLPAEARKGMTLDELKAEIAAGRPVIAWVIGHVQPGTAQDYTSRAGQQVRVAAREHTVMVIGYIPEVVFVLDGGWLYGRAWHHFVDSWGVLGNMAIVYSPPAGSEL
ncbi:MAG: C39 family peptidase, partial [Anaerolineaceae bacterium]|nr:C39 family peptidase [Anaerolineaceae bacterium]